MSESNNLCHLIYFSRAVAPQEDEQLAHLLAQCRRNNLDTAISGMLLYRQGFFLQVLEGNQTAVGKVFDTIRNDPRHTRCDVLQEVSIAARDFPDWSMGYHKLDQTDVDRPGYVDMFGPAFEATVATRRASSAYALLLSFRDLVI